MSGGSRVKRFQRAVTHRPIRFQEIHCFDSWLCSGDIVWRKPTIYPNPHSSSFPLPGAFRPMRVAQVSIAQAFLAGENWSGHWVLEKLLGEFYQAWKISTDMSGCRNCMHSRNCLSIVYLSSPQMAAGACCCPSPGSSRQSCRKLMCACNPLIRHSCELLGTASSAHPRPENAGMSKKNCRWVSLSGEKICYNPELRITKHD